MTTSGLESVNELADVGSVLLVVAEYPLDSENSTATLEFESVLENSAMVVRRISFLVEGLLEYSSFVLLTSECPSVVLLYCTVDASYSLPLNISAFAAVVFIYLSFSPSVILYLSCPLTDSEPRALLSLSFKTSE